MLRVDIISVARIIKLPESCKCIVHPWKDAEVHGRLTFPIIWRRRFGSSIETNFYNTLLGVLYDNQMSTVCRVTKLGDMIATYNSDYKNI